MNPEQILNHVQMLIEGRPLSGNDRWIITYRDNRLQVLPHSAWFSSDVVFEVFTDKQSRDGFTAVIWNRIAKKIAIYLKQKGITLCLQKH